MKIAIINYNMGNLASVQKAVENFDFDVEIISSPKQLNNFDKIILPGVGSFNEAMKQLRFDNWIPNLNEFVLLKKKPILGICLGMQLLGSTGEENETTKGLNFIPGDIKNLKNMGCKKKLPHIGWNDTEFKFDSKLFKDISTGNDFYYVHSYSFKPKFKEHISSIVNYGIDIVASIENENVFGTQFHPEKSSKSGLRLIKNFLNL